MPRPKSKRLKKMLKRQRGKLMLVGVWVLVLSVLVSVRLAVEAVPVAVGVAVAVDPVAVDVGVAVLPVPVCFTKAAP